VGGPNPPVPGGETSETQTLEAGTYAIVCFVDVPDHVPHVMKGMVRSLTVIPAANAVAAAPPTADVVVTLKEYSFNFSTPLTSGKHTLRIDNGGTQPHEILLAQLAPGKTPDDFMKWGQTYEGPPPAKPLGGVAALRPGLSGYISVDLTPGDYMLLCFVADAQDGKPHVMHGMALPVKVS
jgi:hypothetical protein